MARFSSKPLLAALVLMGTAFSLSAADFVPDPFPPAHFTNLYIEKVEKGKITSIQLDGATVTYKVTVGNQVLETVKVQPSGDDWFAFVQGLNQAKVYKWVPDYTYPGQGITWIIDMGMENRKLTSGGTNDYPKEGAEDKPQADPKAGPSVPFQVFWQAALALVGKAQPPTVSK